LCAWWEVCTLAGGYGHDEVTQPVRLITSHLYLTFSLMWTIDQPYRCAWKGMPLDYSWACLLSIPAFVGQASSCSVTIWITVTIQCLWSIMNGTELSSWSWAVASMRHEAGEWSAFWTQCGGGKQIFQLIINSTTWISKIDIWIASMVIHSENMKLGLPTMLYVMKHWRLRLDSAKKNIPEKKSAPLHTSLRRDFLLSEPWNRLFWRFFCLALFRLVPQR
jgi:hypothetical protein